MARYILTAANKIYDRENPKDNFMIEGINKAQYFGESVTDKWKVIQETDVLMDLEKYLQTDRKAYLVYAIKAPDRTWEATRMWLLSDDLKDTEKFVLDNQTDIAENGEYPFIAIQPLTYNTIDIAKDPIKVYEWSKLTNKFYYIGYQATYMNSNEDGKFHYLKPEYGMHHDDISNII